ncbi:MAG: amidohydrolase family protein [Gammaproteobacteria bacterium]|nr:amidohydrolase family protein [Gammaproteobacteria bacterium]MYD79082.1 amidohydrolase family protein [Gammaproteobacteria bacterium]
MATPGSSEWLDLVQEDIIEPDRRIIDPHHHLWESVSMWGRYVLEDLWNDTQSGHNIEKTVFIDCRSNYRMDAPEHMRPIGETEFVASVAAESAKDDEKATIAAIVSHANMTLGDSVEEVLSAHEEAGNGLFRGIRHAGPHDTTGTLTNRGSRQPCPYTRADFQAGVRRLGQLGYTYDTWHFYHQNQEYFELAKAVPETTMILDHFGTPLGVGAYAGRQEEIFEQWKADIADIAQCPNVHAKLGGMAMPDNGFGWDKNPTPPTSDEFAEAQRRYYLHTIECFGPHRCMFESNFPVDRLSISYHVLWNGLKKIVNDFTEEEKDQMFYGTAARVYRI